MVYSVATAVKENPAISAACVAEKRRDRVVAISWNVYHIG
jgi:hypothetical protein